LGVAGTAVGQVPRSCATVAQAAAAQSGVRRKATGEAALGGWSRPRRAWWSPDEHAAHAPIAITATEIRMTEIRGEPHPASASIAGRAIAPGRERSRPRTTVDLPRSGEYPFAHPRGGSAVNARRIRLVVVVACVLAAAPGASSARAATSYAVVRITDEAGIDSASLNPNGQVALSIFQGSCCDDAGYWSAGAIHVLPAACTLCNGFGASAFAINGAGQITGSVSNFDTGTQRDFNQAYRYSISTGQTTLIPTLGGQDAAGEGINGAGQVVGEADLPSLARHAFLWNGSTVKDLGTLGGRNSVAYASYASGQAVGCAQTASGRYHPFRYQSGTMRDLGLPSGMTQGCATSVNASGTVLGYALNGSGGCATWLWHSGTRTVLPKLNGQCILPGDIPGGSSLPSNPGHIANTGQVVGGIAVSPGIFQPVVYQGGTVSRITAAQTPFDPPSTNPGVTPGWSGLATSNNLHGLITALGPNGNGSNTLYLFRPIAIDDETNGAIHYAGSWTRTSLAGAYGGFVKQSSNAGATATLTFTGASVSVIGARGAGLGSAAIQVDGVSKGTVSEAGAAKARFRLKTVFFARPGTHTLTITVTSGTFDLDAITVAPH
jgi:probable HAF family extracellular repeat protein